MAVDTKIRDCAISCAKTIETRGLKSYEAPVVIGCLAGLLAQHSGMTLEQVMEMVGQAAETFYQSNKEVSQEVRHEPN